MRHSQYSRRKKSEATRRSGKQSAGQLFGKKTRMDGLTRFHYLAMAAAAVIILGGILFAGKLNPNQPNGSIPIIDGTQSDLLAAANSPNPLAGMRLFVDPSSHAASQADVWKNTRPEDAAAMNRLAQLPVARWFTSQDSLAELPAYLALAASSNSVPTIVLYNIPFRDCGRYSSGGAGSAAEYEAYLARFSEIVGNQQVIVIVEPDAAANIEQNKDSGAKCLTGEQRNIVNSLISKSVNKLKQLPGTKVYIDGGNNGFVKDPVEMAGGLRAAGVKNSDGFSLNVSNFKTTEEIVSYGNEISAHTGGKHYIIDTSRSGLGGYENRKQPEYGWCNPPGRALGHYPTVTTKVPLVDAFLYVKYPGESDGQDPDKSKCQGGPQAGTWWPDYALGLVQRWPKDLQP